MYYLWVKTSYSKPMHVSFYVQIKLFPYCSQLETNYSEHWQPSRRRIFFSNGYHFHWYIQQVNCSRKSELQGPFSVTLAALLWFSFSPFSISHFSRIPIHRSLHVSMPSFLWSRRAMFARLIEQIIHKIDKYK